MLNRLRGNIRFTAMKVVTIIRGIEQPIIEADIYGAFSGSIDFGTKIPLPPSRLGTKHFIEYDGGRVEIRPVELDHDQAGEIRTYRYRASFDPTSVK